MSIKDRISSDLSQSMKMKDARTTEALRLIRAEILNVEKSGQTKDATDEVVVPVLQRMIKQRKDSIEQFRLGGREDLVRKEEGQIEVIERYLPEMASEEEIRAVVRRVIEETGASGPRDLGKVMGQSMQALKAAGKPVDGARVRSIVQDSLPH